MRRFLPWTFVFLALFGACDVIAGHGRDRGHSRRSSVAAIERGGSGGGSVVCGDGAIEGAEECDDNDTDDGDGCDSSCEIETNCECSGEPSSCFCNTLSVNLDGTDEHLTCGDPTVLDNVAQFTIALRLRANGSWATAGILSKTRTTHFELRALAGGALRLYLTGSTNYIQPATTLVADTWYCFVYTYNGNEVTAADRGEVYLNGVIDTGIAGGTPPAATGANDGALIIGGTSGISNLFTGNIDEVGFWGGHTATALQAAELCGANPVDYSAYSGGAPGAWWRMGDGATHPTIVDEISTFDCTMTNTEIDDIAAEVMP